MLKDNSTLCGHVVSYSGVGGGGDHPPVTDDLEDRVFGTKTHLNRFHVSKDSSILYGSTVSCSGVGGGTANITPPVVDDLKDRVVGT